MPAISASPRNPAGASSTCVGEDLTPQRIQTREAYENAIAVAMAMGCSTNAIIHLIAMARRAGHAIGLDDFERYSRIVPVIGNVAERQHIPDGGLLLRRRHPGADERDPRAPASRLPDRERPDAGRGDRGRACPQCRRDPAAVEPGLRPGLARGAEGQPRAERLRHQAGGDGPALPQACRPGPRLRRLPVLKAAIDDEDLGRDRRSRARPAQCRAAGRGRACPNGACCRCRRSSSRRVTPRHAAPVGCADERHQLRRLRAPRRTRNPSSAGRWRSCARRHRQHRRRGAVDPHGGVGRGTGAAARPPGPRRRPATSAATA